MEEIKEKKNKLKDLEEENVRLQEEVLRAKADLINYRKRKDEEVSDFKNYANADLIYELLPIIDNFERAIVLDDNNLSDELSKFLSGFKMIYAGMKDILEKAGISEMKCLGEKFDSRYHDCLFTDNDPTKEDDIILDVLLKGYIYKDKVLRCASVKVNKLEEKNNEESII
ncbi:MAG TPA: nucleotide exchange factor GrpE [Bacilli bacterium]|nr:nucleotide exchange factor GrpE [Bacilli bacterium]